MKSVMLSIQPKWVEKIIKGEKKIEVRKTRPKYDCWKEKGKIKVVTLPPQSYMYVEEI